VTAHSLPHFEWDDALNVGEEMLDCQHRKLVDLINRVSKCAETADQDEQLMHCLTGMYLYAKEHFWDEEALMARIGYPGLEHHALLHQGFIEKTNALTDACLADAVSYKDLLDFLVSWLFQHITREDTKIMAFARSQSAG